MCAYICAIYINKLPCILNINLTGSLFHSFTTYSFSVFSTLLNFTRLINKFTILLITFSFFPIMKIRYSVATVFVTTLKMILVSSQAK